MDREERLTNEEATPSRRRTPRTRQSQRVQHEALAEESEDRVDRDEDMDEGDMADDERFAAFLSNINQSALPNLPDIPGYHVCWLSTTHQRDTITSRNAMGYELLTQDMVKGWNAEVYLKSAQYPGVISLNEMVAARIPMALYKRMMRHLHHTLPLSEEEKIRANTRQMQEQAQEVRGRLIEESGMAEIVQQAPAPRFE